MRCGDKTEVNIESLVCVFGCPSPTGIFFLGRLGVDHRFASSRMRSFHRNDVDTILKVGQIPVEK